MFVFKRDKQSVLFIFNKTSSTNFLHSVSLTLCQLACLHFSQLQLKFCASSRSACSTPLFLIFPLFLFSTKNGRFLLKGRTLSEMSDLIQTALHLGIQTFFFFFCYGIDFCCEHSCKCFYIAQYHEDNIFIISHKAKYQHVAAAPNDTRDREIVFLLTSKDLERDLDLLKGEKRKEEKIKNSDSKSILFYSILF